MMEIRITSVFAFWIAVSTCNALPHGHQGRAVNEKEPFTFEDLYDPRFYFSSFYPSWISDSEYIERGSDGIAKVDIRTDDRTVIVPDDVYSSTAAQGWSLSADENYFFVRRNYTKQWRYSYNSSYSVYSVTNGNDALLDLPTPDVQYMRWSPSGSGLVWVRGNDLYYASSPSSDVKRITSDGRQNAIYNGIPDWVYEEEMIGTRHVIYWSPDSRFLAFLTTDDTHVKQIEFSTYKGQRYPETVKVAYPKAGESNPVITLRVVDLLNSTLDEYLVKAPESEVGTDHLFSKFHWYPNSTSFLVSWLNRTSNKCVPQLCQFNSGWTCEIVQSGIEVSDSGWIGNGGTPFTPKFTSDEYNTYITAFSNDFGYWHVAVVNATSNEKRYLTTGTSVVTSISGYDKSLDYVYFIAAAPEPGSRNVYRVPYSSAAPVDVQDWECMSCDIDMERCQYVTPSFSPGWSFVVMNCAGPDVPMSTIHQLDSDGNYVMQKVYVNNTNLIELKQTKLWPSREVGSFIQFETKFLFEMYYPENFDPSKKYPLLIEVYGGPGFQKVRNRWTRSWAQTHMVSQYEILVASFDGRGSGYRGDGIAHMLYKKLGQLEKKDTTALAQYFINNYKYVDASRIAVWGWSYGGYTTTFTISEGSGVFKCGLAVAPLASRYYYDTIHTERYMDLPYANPDGYEKCSLLNTDLKNFGKAAYIIIHGTADDNVHFQNAALFSKALVEADVPFENFFYADEAHSINTGPNANKHIYKKLTRKVRDCFNLEAPKTLT